LVLAASSARFGYPEVKIGFVPAMVLAILRRNVSEKLAFELLTRGEELNAAKALELGLVNQVFEEEQFEVEVANYVNRFGELSKSAIALTKTLLYQIDGLSFVEALETGADVNVKTDSGSLLSFACSPAAAQRLLVAGADPAELSREARRRMLGLSGEPDLACLDVSSAEFKLGAACRFGCDNPEEIDEPFWAAMIRSGVDAWQAAQTFQEAAANSPVWCAQRFGQSFTFLPDGRIVEIAGEHEDSYDPDFCIYNDVFVHDRGSVRIYGYPEHVFPPTDFHTATLIDRVLVFCFRSARGSTKHRQSNCRMPLRCRAGFQ